MSMEDCVMWVHFGDRFREFSLIVEWIVQIAAELINAATQRPDLVKFVHGIDIVCHEVELKSIPVEMAIQAQKQRFDPSKTEARREMQNSIQLFSFSQRKLPVTLAIVHLLIAPDFVNRHIPS